MVFTVPNLTDAPYPAQAGLDSGDVAIIAAGHSPTGVVTGAAVTAQATPNMTVAVAAGLARVVGRRVAVAGGTATIGAANATNPRHDLVTIDTAGTLAVVAGTPAPITSTSEPAYPAIPAGRLVLAAIYVPAAATAITTSMVTDKRVLIEAATVENVLSYGATGDGATDDTAAISAAMDAANAAGIPLYFPRTTTSYLSGQIIKAYAPRILSDGATITVTSTNNWNWQFQGALGASVALSANVAAGSNTATVASATGFAVGDLVLVTDDTVVYDPQYTSADAGYFRYHGQQVKISAIAGTTITFEEPVQMLIQSTQNGVMQKVNPIRDGYILGLQFSGPGGTTTVGFLRIDYAFKLDIDVEGFQATAAGVYLRSCYDVRLRGRFTDFIYNGALNQFAYGVLLAAACSNIRCEIYCYNGANGLTTTGENSWHGEPVNCSVSGINSGSSTTGFTCHPSGRNITFYNCQVIGARSGNAFELRSPGASIIGGRAEYCDTGVKIQDAGADITVTGLRLRNITNNGIVSSDPNNALAGVVITECDVAEIGRNFIDFQNAAQDVVVKNNRAHNVGTLGTAGQNRFILCEKTTGPGLTRARVTFNTLTATATNKTAFVLGVNTGATHTAVEVAFNAVFSGIGLVSQATTGVTAPTTGNGANYSTAT